MRSDGGHASGVVRPASPDASPAAVLARTLDAWLRTEMRDQFAGFATASDGVLEVFGVGSDVRFAEAVSRIRQAVAPEASVRVLQGREHSLASLEELRDQISARRDAVAALGVTITEWGVDQRINKVRIGALDLADAQALLASEFGADRIEVVRGNVFTTTAR